MKANLSRTTSKNIFKIYFAVIFSILLLLPQITSALSLNSGLVGYWTFDGKNTSWGSNTTSDLSGNGNTGTMTNMSTTTSPTVGKIGQGLRFDGVDDSVNLINVVGEMSVSEGSASIWFIEKSGGAGFDFLLELRADGANEISIYDGHGDFSANLKMDYYAGGTQEVPINTVITKDVWHHAVLTWSKSNDRVRAYIDGGLSGSTTGLGTWSGTITTANVGNAQWLGNIDDVRIYNREISATEVKQLYSFGQVKAAASPVNALNSGLVGYWTFDGKNTSWGSNTTIDVSGNGKTGTMTSMSTSTVPVAGKIGQGFKFDGVDDDVTMGNVLSFEKTDRFSYSAWVKLPTASPATADFIMGKVGDSGGWPGTEMYIRGDGSGDRIKVALRSSTESLIVSSGDQTWVANKWTHLVWTYDASVTAAGMKIYRDGVELATVTDVQSLNTTTIANTGNFMIGEDDITPFWPFDGHIDDVRVYNRTLSAAEVAKLYKDGQTKAAASPTNTLNSGLVGYWTFDGKDMPSGQVNDVSGQGKHSSQVGMSTSTAYVAGKIGQGLLFDGVDDHIKISSPTTFSDQATMSTWIKTTSTEQDRIFTHAVPSGDFQNLGTVINRTANKVTFNCRDTADNWLDSTSNINDGKWHLVTATRATNLFSIYIDGVLENSATWTCTTSYDSATEDRIGQYPLAAPNENYTGVIDDVRIYTRALSAAEVAKLYRDGLVRGGSSSL